MKRILGILVLIIMIYAVYFDITTGTLPKMKLNQDAAETSLSIQYVEVEIKPGDTLLSLIESQGGYPENTSIEQMINDFSSLNNGLKPDEMKFGETYKIPVYAQDVIAP